MLNLREIILSRKRRKIAWAMLRGNYDKALELLSEYPPYDRREIAISSLFNRAVYELILANGNFKMIYTDDKSSYERFKTIVGKVHNSQIGLIYRNPETQECEELELLINEVIPKDNPIMKYLEKQLI